MEKEKAIEKIQGLEASEVHVYTPEELEELKTNLVKSEVDKQIGDKIGKLHQQYDDDLEALTGKKRPSGMKTYDFMRDIWGKLKDKADSASLMEREVADLREKVRKGASDSVSEELAQKEKELKSLQKALETQKAEYDANLQDLQKQHKQYKVSSAMDAYVSTLKLKDLPKSVLDNHISTVKGKLSQMADFDGDQLVFRENDEIIRSKETMKPKTHAEMLDEYLVDVVEDGRKQPGTGSNPDFKSKSSLPPSDIRTKKQYAEFLVKEEGMLMGSAEFKEALKNSGFPDE